MSDLFDTLLSRSADHWQAFTQHDFVRQLGSGQLQRASFEHYLKQDYVFLKHFARAHGLAAFKSSTLQELQHAKGSLVAIVDIEMDLHVQYCKRWGITQTALEQVEESTANMAYTRFVMERGLAGELLDLNVALAPCIVGYAHIATWLSQQAFTVLDGNAYCDWMDMYLSEQYQQVAKSHIDMINRGARDLSTERVADLSKTFAAATRLESDFWHMGLHRL